MSDINKEDIKKLILAGSFLAVIVFVFTFVSNISTCAIGKYNYTKLDGSTGVAEECKYEGSVPVCTNGNTTIVVSEFYKNKWCR